ncbi:alpha-amylase family glycosyl hydrolase [Thermobrachium celere]|uniref:alpha-amylase family glycosyl hydrolase n=1 Tax=Thermobrachium celere TaxID=53422 RepID=UPI001941B8A2|nr:alpha-amylase family glycosyl hydrolase [Thermobrachium celere]GFR35624.1 alpha-amylase [Thermobrachium celere]
MKRRICALILTLITLIFSVGCFFDKEQTIAPRKKQDGLVVYQIFVRSFYDSDGDGIGDLNGVTKKLDYIKSLGVNAIWLNPIYPSPSYHGYDVTDYKDINKEFGTMQDFENLINKAHENGIKVILDFVPNHTSSKHPWFEKALKGDRKYKNYYIWSNKDTNLKELSGIGQKAWHTKDGQNYYYATFWSEMPDLNYDNKKVRKEIKEIAKFWLDKGIDGFRIDAALHIYEGKRYKDTVAWWQEFANYVRSIKNDVYIVGEVWDSEGKIAPFFTAFDSCFNFNLAEKIIEAVNTGFSTKLSPRIKNCYDTYKAEYKDYVDAPFLTNHDIDRVMSRLDSVEKNKAAAVIYLSLPGNPFIYYGEEIGMKGYKPDEEIREPFKWYRVSGEGQTKWEMIKHNVGEYSPSVEEQDKDENSLLNFYRDFIKFRLNDEVMKHGDIVSFDINPLVASFIREYNGEKRLIIVNIREENITIDKDLLSKNGFEKIIKGKAEDVVENGIQKYQIKPYEYIILSNK